MRPERYERERWAGEAVGGHLVFMRLELEKEEIAVEWPFPEIL
jgi:hypothetical protein